VFSQQGLAGRIRMTQYRGIVSVTFDDEDLQELCDACGVESMDPYDAIQGSLDNLELGSGWLEQFFVNGSPKIGRLSGGISVEVNEHELD